ncbi:MAG: hypothetical protein IH971_10040 [Candidatus Marinimicrobia bacterium]|nr:hypothetical protein [Candidatus Neomarinimicrobiota bacterium]
MPREPIKLKRLTQAGIGEDDLTYFIDTFVQPPGRYWYKSDYKSPWQFVKSKTGIPIGVKEYENLRHLVGDIWVAKCCPGKTDFICIDIDNKGPVPVMIRYIEVCSLFHVPAIVFRSSKSGGLHVYYFFPTKVWRDPLKNWLQNRISGLPQFDIPLEYLPGNLDHLRLPLGRDSILLSPQTLEPMGLTLKESLDYIKQYRKQNELEFTDEDYTRYFETWDH